jgi:pimeloyl-ACP methyl ester carboxylesterase
LVQPEIAKFARVITYDRAGYAWSDASPLPRTAENMVQELHTMLHNANIPAPYILIGHSFGGLNVRLFAAQYPEEVAGVILIDAAHEDLFVNMMACCGIFRMLNLLPFVSNKADAAIKKYPEFLRRICLAQNLSTKYINTLTQEGLCLQESCKQIQQNCGQLGDVPLTVVSSAQPWPGAKNAEFNTQWSVLQADLATKSSCAKQIILGCGGHNISYDQPEAIIDAVRQMTEELKLTK